MKDKLTVGLFSFIVLVIACIVIISIVKSADLKQIHVSDEVLITFRENCVQYYVHTGKAYEIFLVCTDNGLFVYELESITQCDRDAMPAFSNIREPLLTDHAEYIHRL